MVEMLVVFVVFAILVAAIVPVVSNFMPGVKLTGASRDLLSSLREVQEIAITEQNQLLVRFDLAASPKNYKLIRKIGAVETTLRQKNIPEDISITLDPTITSSQVVFSPDGGPSCSGNITLTAGAKSKIVSVSPAGYLKIE